MFCESNQFLKNVQTLYTCQMQKSVDTSPSKLLSCVSRWLKNWLSFRSFCSCNHRCTSRFWISQRWKPQLLPSFLYLTSCLIIPGHTLRDVHIFWWKGNHGLNATVWTYSDLEKDFISLVFIQKMSTCNFFHDKAEIRVKKRKYDDDIESLKHDRSKRGVYV